MFCSAPACWSTISTASACRSPPTIAAGFPPLPGQIGLLFSAFFWSYSLLQLPGGMVLDRFGIKTGRPLGRIPVGRGIRPSPHLASGYAGIFAARLLLGIAEAPGMTGNQKATGYWFPRNER